MSLHILLLIGLIGSLLLFIGDMLLYYSKSDYSNENMMHSIIEIMKKVGTKRLYTGGILGLFASFLSCIGSYHFVLIVAEKYRYLGWALFFINAAGMSIGGSYHSHCAYLGLIGRHENKASLDEVLNYLKLQAKLLFSIMALATTAQAVLIALGVTVFPKSFVLFSPLPLMLLTPLVKRLPKGLHMILAGGWKSLVLLIYYSAALIGEIV